MPLSTFFRLRNRHGNDVSKRARRMGYIFIGVVLLPGCILSVLALHTVSKENAWIEKRIRTTLTAECTTVAVAAQKVMLESQMELDTLFSHPFSVNDTFYPPVSPLVAVPFLLSSKRAIVRPLYTTSLSGKDLNFIKYNKEFFQDQKAVLQSYRTPVRSSITTKSGGTIYSLKPAKSTMKITSEYEEIHRLSVDTVESVRFSQIIANKTYGIIPRIIDDEIMLLFWKRASENRIVGCMLREAELKQRIAALIPKDPNDTRTILILDHQGVPIAPALTDSTTAQGAPFVAVDISDMLPQWKVAAYLPDPHFIAARSNLNAIIVGLLIALLLTALMGGGILVIRSVNAEITLAQQRTTFVANVSHELKTPLTSIRLFAEILKQGRQPDPEKQKNYLGIMVAETERLTRLINNVLDFSRAQNDAKRRYSMEPLDIVDLCKNVFDDQRLRLEYNHFVVDFVHKASSAMVLADSEAMQQALLNLLSNSEKYSPHEKWVGLSVAAAGNTCTIDVMDKGIGIGEEHVPMIFDKFYRVDNSLTAPVQGTGLGLTITKQIIEDHHGTISYFSEAPYKSIFRIVLPLIMEKEDETEDPCRRR